MSNHKSDCAIHNAPAMSAGLCDCGAERTMTPEEIAAEIVGTHTGLYALETDRVRMVERIAAAIRTEREALTVTPEMIQRAMVPFAGSVNDWILPVLVEKALRAALTASALRRRTDMAESELMARMFRVVAQEIVHQHRLKFGAGPHPDALVDAIDNALRVHRDVGFRAGYGAAKAEAAAVADEVNTQWGEDRNSRVAGETQAAIVAAIRSLTASPSSSGPAAGDVKAVDVDAIPPRPAAGADVE